MKFAHALRVAAVFAAVGSFTPGAHAETASAAPAGEGDPVVAKVNGSEIRRSDVERAIAALPPHVQPQIQMMPPQMVLPMMLDQVITGKLIAQEGYARNLQNEKEVKERLKRAEERFVQEQYLTKEVDARITPERLQEAYQEYLEENPPQDEIRASHILVESEDEAKRIIGELKQGADFAKIAQEKSTDTAAAAQGGDLGYFTKDQMVEPFAEAAFAMKPGDISETPVQTQFGWHVIKVTDQRKSAPPAFADVQDELRASLSETIVAEVVDKLRADAKIERFQDALVPPEAAPDAGQPGAGQKSETTPQ